MCMVQMGGTYQDPLCVKISVFFLLFLFCCENGFVFPVSLLMFSLRTPVCVAGCVSGFLLGVRGIFHPKTNASGVFSLAYPLGISPSFPQSSEASVTLLVTPSLSLHPEASFRPGFSSMQIPSRWPGC